MGKVCRRFFLLTCYVMHHVNVINCKNNVTVLNEIYPLVRGKNLPSSDPPLYAKICLQNIAEQSWDRSAEDVVVEQHGRQRPGVNPYGRNVVPKNS